MQRAIGMAALRAAAQDHRVARLQAQRAGVRGHVGAALVDDADDAERHAPRARSRARSAAAMRPRRVPIGSGSATTSSMPRGDRLDALRVEAAAARAARRSVSGARAAARSRALAARIVRAARAHRGARRPPARRSSARCGASASTAASRERLAPSPSISSPRLACCMARRSWPAAAPSASRARRRPGAAAPGRRDESSRRGRGSRGCASISEDWRPMMRAASASE